MPDTDAVDHLIGRWDDDTGTRVDGGGFHAIAELAWNADRTGKLAPTVIDEPGEGGGLLIDWLLVNEAMRTHVDASTYRVHIPAGPPPSDHYLVSATFSL
ncbi:hypothetical protein [Nucisporomicrobium flavum]|uniref:hypothetical protein n=1 Tax=Nucisporomicrobium flavum TaxID=2785915 RepID=UPI0018F5FFF6|nr:hypothetical protein [Nucisporomicrobium flavum]